jgi:hypothetical protein
MLKSPGSEVTTATAAPAPMFVTGDLPAIARARPQPHLPARRKWRGLQRRLYPAHRRPRRGRRRRGRRASDRLWRAGPTIFSPTRPSRLRTSCVFDATNSGAFSASRCVLHLLRTSARSFSLFAALLLDKQFKARYSSGLFLFPYVAPIIAVASLDSSCSTRFSAQRERAFGADGGDRGAKYQFSDSAVLCAHHGHWSCAMWVAYLVLLCFFSSSARCSDPRTVEAARWMAERSQQFWFL